MILRNTLAQIAGDSAYGHALFYHYPGGLRFELSAGGSPLDQVLTALRKATSICDDIFDGDAQILVHLRKKSWDSSPFALRSTLRELDLAGIHIPADHEAWIVVEDGVTEDDFAERSYTINCVFNIPTAKLQNLLWCAFASDFAPLSPNPKCRIYLAEPRKGVIVHPYDDRGMDIVGCGHACLQTLHVKHGQWLSDYDKATMRRTFSAS